MKALITGVEGFVGKYLLEELLKQNYDVAGTYLAKHNLSSHNIRLYELNILDLLNAKKIIRNFKPDLIFHLAAISSVKFSFDNPEITKKINVDGTKNMLSAAPKDSKILFISSAHVYGIPKKVPITEEHPLAPNSPYAESKVLAEKLALKHKNTIVVRSFNHIGPGQLPDFAVPSFAKQIADIEKGKKKPVLSVGNLDSERDFTDVRDIVKAYILALEKGQSCGVYNIGTGKAYRMRKILDMLIAMSNSKIDIKYDRKRMRSSDIPILQCDASKFRQRTGWKPEISIEKSLRDILEYERILS